MMWPFRNREERPQAPSPAVASGQPPTRERASWCSGLVRPSSPAIVPPKVPKFALAAGGEVIVPPGVKVTQCPSGRDTRFTAEGPLMGEFTRDWLEKRKPHEGGR